MILAVLITIVVVLFFELILYFFLKNKYFSYKNEVNQMWAEIFEKHDGVMLLIDPDQNGLILKANIAASKYYGYSLKELYTMSIKDINCLAPEDVQNEMNQAKEESRNYFNFKHRLKNGNIRDVEVHSTPLQTQGKKRILFSIIHDITDKNLFKDLIKKKNEELKKINESLETRIQEATKTIKVQERQLAQKEKSRALSELLFNISHHWRQPLNNIYLASQDVGDLIEENDLNINEIMENQKLIQKEAKELSHTITKINQFYNESYVYLKKEFVNIQEVIKQIILDDQNIELDFYSNTSSRIFTNKNVIRQVFQELIFNSLHAQKTNTKSTLKIKLSLSKEGEQIVIEFEDNSGGIKDENIDRIFEPYFRIGYKGKNKGLGLYLIKNLIVNFLDGNITVKNTLDGLKTTIRIPK